MNIVDPELKTMGYAYRGGADYGCVYGQDFGYGWNDYGQNGMSVSEYRNLFYNYYNRVTTELREAQEAYGIKI